ncbi:response regulator [Undibacterium squillarum]|uniref:histidine kinase n=1 Tax=Undibacterium squillarum TaxID=1131567 RepID=A0ABQ2XRE6_9BURK|nr:response regulator [Undibacterium squillarum]GGX30561.1 hypothetical protein GCM10010946_04540 [Undibacterium squillarum]
MNKKTGINVTQTELDWREQCFVAFDLMRDSPQMGRLIAGRLKSDAVASRRPVLGTLADLLSAYADFFEGKLSAAEPEFERTAMMFELIGDSEGLAFALLGTVSVWWRHGKAEQAYSLCHARILQLLPAKDHRLSVLVFNLLGALSQDLGYTEEAIRHLYNALGQARRLHIPNRASQILANLGEVLYISGNAEDAEPLLEEAREIAVDSDERWLAPFISTMLALCYLAREKYDDAYSCVANYLAKGAAHYTDKASKAFFSAVASYTLAKRGQLSEAERLCEAALELIEDSEDRPLRSYAWWVSGYLHRCHQRYPEAIHALKHAIAVAGDKGYIYTPLRAMAELIEIYGEIGHWELGFKEQQRYLEMYARAQGLATRVHVQTLHIRHELQEAELARRLAEEAVVQRKALDDQLQRILAERETILENSIVGMLFLDNHGRIKWANTPLCQLFGFERDVVLGSSLEQFYPSRENFLQCASAVSAAVWRGESFDSEIQMRRADGSLFWVHFSGRAVDQTRPALGTVWVVMDITLRRQLEINLSVSEQRYKQVVENASEGIVVLQHGKAVFFNSRICQLFGRDSGALRGSVFSALLNADWRAGFDAHVSHCLENGGHAADFSCNLSHASGELVWIEMSSVLIEWDGAPANLSFISDVTQKKLLEQQLRESMAEQMRLQTLQMENDLREAERARIHAEETTAAKSMFLANMSHEIRTPMNAIIGMAHLALRTGLNEKQRDYVEKIHRAGVSLLGIINDILDFSKVEAGKLRIEQVEFDLHEVFENISLMTADRAFEKKLEFLIQIDPEVPWRLMGDGLRLSQVLINLVNNAIKFTDHGQVTLSCKLVRRDSAQATLGFTVSDTGIGMSSEQQNRLFQPFSQADESTTRRFGGTGLGLSISRRVVELMGGCIELQSQEGDGTTVSCEISFTLAEKWQPIQVLRDQPLKALIVDDHAQAARALVELLRFQGIDAVVVDKSVRAIDLISSADQNDGFDLVFSDLMMPQLDGLALINLLKNLKILRKKPKYILTGMLARDGARSELDAPDAFLRKPVTLHALQQCLASMMPESEAGLSTTMALSIPRFSGLRVLLVEDNEVNQQIARELLEAAGIEVDIAENGHQALSKLAPGTASNYGMVLMDVQMPELDGHEATMLIRKDGRYSRLPIIAMTAHAMPIEQQRCIDSGMDEHLAKPVEPASLYEIVARYCPEFLCAEKTLTEPVRAAEMRHVQIPGLIVADGLRRTMGDVRLYAELLRRFQSDQSDAAQTGRQAYIEGRMQDAIRIIHTLKGVAGLVAANLLRDAAEGLEMALREKKAAREILQFFDQCEQLLQQALQAAEEAMRNLPVQDAKKNQEHTGLNMQLIRQCLNQLHQSDADAIELIEENADQFSQIFGVERYKSFSSAIRDFDFPTAAGLLHEQLSRENA